MPPVVEAPVVQAAAPEEPVLEAREEEEESLALTHGFQWTLELSWNGSIQASGLELERMIRIELG